jgi:prevent-host-death family protein
MREVRTTELESQVVELLGNVEAGETIVITRDGRPVARLVPEGSSLPTSSATTQRVSQTVREVADATDAAVAIERLRRLRATLPRVGITFDEAIAMRHEGHRYR